MKNIRLKNHLEIIIDDAKKEDAAHLIKYVKKVANETDFLTFNGDEFNKTIEEEENIIEQFKLAKNQIFIIAKLEHKIIGILNVGSSQKERLKHNGEFGISVLSNGQTIISRFRRNLLSSFFS